jgi:hypothetical protein
MIMSRASGLPSARTREAPTPTTITATVPAKGTAMADGEKRFGSRAMRAASSRIISG